VTVDWGHVWQFVTGATFIAAAGAAGTLIAQFMSARWLERIRALAAKDLEAQRATATERIETQRSEATKEIERLRQSASLEIETARAAAARQLAQFKTELLLAAEVRRQVASARMQVVTNVMILADQLIIAVGDQESENDPEMGKVQRARVRKIWNELAMLLRHNEHLFSSASAKELQQLAADVQTWGAAAALQSDTGRTTPAAGTAFQRYLDASGRLADVVRRALGTDLEP
jgi:hypothetical protein